MNYDLGSTHVHLQQDDPLRFQFKTKKLERLYTEEKEAYRYPSGVVSAFFEAMVMIDAAQNIQD